MTDDRTRIDCTPGNFVKVINAVEGYCRASLFLKGGRLYRKAPDGLAYRVTSVWFTDFLQRQFAFVDNGKAVKPPGFIFPQIQSRLGLPPHELVPLRSPGGIKPDPR